MRKSQVGFKVVELIIALMVLGAMSYFVYTGIFGGGGQLVGTITMMEDSFCKQQGQTAALLASLTPDLDSDLRKDSFCDVCIKRDASVVIDTSNELDSDGDKVPEACDLNDKDARIGFCNPDDKDCSKVDCSGFTLCKEGSLCGPTVNQSVIKKIGPHAKGYQCVIGEGTSPETATTPPSVSTSTKQPTAPIPASTPTIPPGEELEKVTLVDDTDCTKIFKAAEDSYRLAVQLTSQKENFLNAYAYYKLMLGKHPNACIDKHKQVYQRIQELDAKVTGSICDYMSKQLLLFIPQSSDNYLELAYWAGKDALAINMCADEWDAVYSCFQAKIRGDTNQNDECNSAIESFKKKKTDLKNEIIEFLKQDNPSEARKKYDSYVQSYPIEKDEIKTVVVGTVSEELIRRMDAEENLIEQLNIADRYFNDFRSSFQDFDPQLTPSAYFRISLTNEQLASQTGRTEYYNTEAIKFYQLAIDQYPDSEFASTAKGKIENLGATVQAPPEEIQPPEEYTNGEKIADNDFRTRALQLEAKQSIFLSVIWEGKKQFFWVQRVRDYARIITFGAIRYDISVYDFESLNWKKLDCDSWSPYVSIRSGLLEPTLTDTLNKCES